ncbi:MAG TPA: M48 family metallopeptidase [Noviherbaspirillum sp.]|uniref:M48 family metallopeptidase n=1 Tax=Noviherbaspirillum sp. TaxID=1926288 RepID=UPI002F925962
MSRGQQGDPIPAGAAAVPGRLFGPGVAEGGAAAIARWRDGSLIVEAPGRCLRVPAAQARPEAAGFNLGHVRVDWRDDEGAFAFFIDDEAGCEAFLATAPPVLDDARRALRARRRGTTRRFRAALVVYALLVLLPFIALAAFLMQSERIAGWVAAQVPRSVEARLGQLVLAQTQARVELVEDGAAHAAVQQIGGMLAKDLGYDYRWLVARDPAVNAFAAPAGIIVVNTGLIAHARAPAELAGVIAHEISHVERRHALQAMIRSAGMGVLLSLAIGDWSGGAVGAWAAGLADLRFSREAETQADADALLRLHRAGIDPAPMAAFFGRLAQDENGIPGLSILATHPPSAERMEALRAQIARLPASAYRPLPIDWTAVQASLPR